MMPLFHPNGKNKILCWTEKQAVYDLQNKNVAGGHVVEEQTEWRKPVSDCGISAISYSHGFWMTISRKSFSGREKKEVQMSRQYS